MALIRIKKLTGTAKIPTKGSDYAAGYDLYADGIGDEVWAISPGMNRLIKTGIAMEIPERYFGAIYPRSGLSTKRGLRLSNCTGVIDADYRGEILVSLYNDSTETQLIHAGDRIAQIIFEPFLPVEFEEAKELTSTERGNSGFGSTGTH